MGLLTILKKMKQKEKEIRLLMLYPLVEKSKGKASLFVWNLLNFWFNSKYSYIMIIYIVI